MNEIQDLNDPDLDATDRKVLFDGLRVINSG
jgi:hypothetical protein